METKILSQKEFATLINAITPTTLDPRFVHQEGYSFKEDPHSFHPKSRKKAAEMKDYYHIWMSACITGTVNENGKYRLYITEDQNEILKKHIADIEKTDEYQNDFHSMYNHIRFDLTTFADEYLDLPKFGTPEWWIRFKGGTLLPLDASEDAIQRAIKEQEDRFKVIEVSHKEKGFNILHHKIQKEYDVLHWRPEEAKEIEYHVKAAFPSVGSIPWYQASRYTEKEAATLQNKLSEFTLTSTGRKMLFRPHRYGFQYVELDPIVKL